MYCTKTGLFRQSLSHPKEIGENREKSESDLEKAIAGVFPGADLEFPKGLPGKTAGFPKESDRKIGFQKSVENPIIFSEKCEK